MIKGRTPGVCTTAELRRITLRTASLRPRVDQVLIVASATYHEPVQLQDILVYTVTDVEPKLTIHISYWKILVPGLLHHSV